MKPFCSISVAIAELDVSNGYEIESWDDTVLIKNICVGKELSHVGEGYGQSCKRG